MNEGILVAKSLFRKREKLDAKTLASKEYKEGRETLDARILEIANGQKLMLGEFNVLANEPYDAEVPMPPVIEAFAETKSVDKGDDYKYWAISATTKTVYTVVDGSIVQVNVSPTSPSQLTFSDYDTPEEYIYLKEISESKYDALALKAIDQMEALDRLESKLTFDAVIAAAVSASNTYANISGSSTLTYDKLVEITSDLAMWGSKFVLISGSQVSLDVKLMNYRADKNDKYTLAEAGIDEWFKVEAYQYQHSGTQTVLATDKAIVIATNDSKKNKPVHFVRRKTDMFDNSTTKERLFLIDGPAKHVGSNRVWSYSVVAYGNFGIVVVNANACAVYKKASSYS